MDKMSVYYPGGGGNFTERDSLVTPHPPSKVCETPIAKLCKTNLCKTLIVAHALYSYARKPVESESI